jgi:hypothetical protein
MLPSLCRLMASIPSVSCFPGPGGCRRGPLGAGAGADDDSDLASVVIAGSIGTRIVARLYFEGPLR